MSSIDVTFARGDDWEGLYVDGVLQQEGHSIPAHDILEWIKDFGEVTISEYESREVNLSWLDDRGSLPHYLTEVVWGDEDYTPEDWETELLDDMDEDVQALMDRDRE